MAVGEERSPSWLLLRHFPVWLTSEEKQSLLTHFGAVDVVVMPTKGKMRNCIFAAFNTHLEATQAMGKLHQLDVLGSRLVVEYTCEKLMSGANRDKWSCNNTPWKEAEVGREDTEEIIVKSDPARLVAAPPPPPPPPALPPPRYRYPLVSHSILTNITSTLVCVPEFYQQVLHLMNKMNLPPPFGALTPAPPLITPLAETQLQAGGNGDDEEKEGSEMESDEEESAKRREKRKISAPVHSAKRRKVSYLQVKNSKSLLNKPTATTTTGSQEDLEGPSSRVKIELRVPSTLTPHKTEESETVTYIQLISKTTHPNQGDTTPLIKAPPPKEGVEPLTEEGLVKVIESEGATTRAERSSDFISLSEINSSKLTQEEMKESHVYKKYSPGEPSTRLYVKNLAKQVEEKDLHYIFGRYVNWTVEEQKNMFDVRLMQTGRMKGQAFVGLPGESEAARAIQETNGYVLYSKPMVVHFARSTKPKSQDV